jgi:hypothetical protein
VCGGSRLGLSSGWCRCSLFVTPFSNDPGSGVFLVMCPGEETGAGLAPLAGLIRSLSALWGRDPSQSCRQRFHPQTGTGVVPQLGLEVVTDACR